jgi:DNA polymerase-1
MLYFIGPYQTRYKTAELNDVIRFMERESKFCFDTETTGLNPHRDKVIMVQIGNDEFQFVIDARHVDITPLLPYLVSPDKMKIGSNLAFDYKMMLGNYGIRMQNLGDTMIREKVLETGRKQRGFGLKDLAKKYLKVNMPKEVRTEFTHIHNQPFDDRQILYGGNDVKYPIRIYYKQQLRIQNDQLGVTVHLEQQYVRVIAEMEFWGMPFREDIWNDIYHKNVDALVERLAALDDYVRDNKITKYLGPVDMFTGKQDVHMNWGSPKQVGELFKSLGLPVEKLDFDKMDEVKDVYGLNLEIFKISIGKEELARLADTYPIAKLFLDYKKAYSAVTKYGLEWVKKYVDREMGRVRTRFNQVLNTGRISSSSPNVQQIPSFKSSAKASWEAHRTAFVAPEGWTLVVRDYSAQESRVLADLAKEEAMIQEYITGTGDMHSLTGSKVFSLIEGRPVKVSKKENAHYRNIAKVVNFASAYGATGGTLARKLNISKEMGDDIINSFYQAYPQLRDYFVRRHSEILKNGYLIIDPFTNRKIYFPAHKRYKENLEIMQSYQEEKYRNRVLGYEEPEYPKEVADETRKLEGSLKRAAQNFPIQSISASMTKIAMSMMYDWILKNGYEDSIRIVLALHDEIVLECKKEVAEIANEKLGFFMEHAGTYFCKSLPMASDGGSTEVWDH